MKHVWYFFASVSVFCLIFGSASAQPDRGSVGLGAAFGVALPEGSTDEVQVDDWDPSFNWGFYVDIPSDATGCNEGYLVVGDTKTKTGYWRNAVYGTGTITFTKCGTLTKPSTEPGPDEKN